MDKPRKSEKGNEKKLYRDSLIDVCKARYLDKLKVIDGKDPYLIGESEWGNDLSKWPEVTYPDIVNYLVYSVSAYTLQQLKAYKSLHAYNYFISGFVLNIGHIIVNDKCVIAGEVKHSQCMNLPGVFPWVICEKDGTVISGHCTCMAGVGEVCSHVGALLFAVEASVKIRNSKTVTEEKCYWLPSAVQKVQYKTIQEIDFTSARTKKKQLDQALSSGATPTPLKPRKLPTVSEPTEEELSSFYSTLDTSESRPVLLSLLPGFANKFRPKALDKKYPKVLSELNDDQYSATDKDKLNEKCEEIFETLSVSKEESENCENDTRAQSSSKQWFSFRTGRVTASRVKAACRTSADNPSKSLIKDICYPASKSFTSKQTQWGCDHEKNAKKQYIKSMMKSHENFEWRDSGFVINPSYPYMGATPDGIGSCDCCGEVIIEIKCPYCEKDSSISDSIDCLEKKDEKLSLKRGHSYYYQVQCQLLLCEKEFCDFILWTNVDFTSERIVIDTEFCNDMVEKSKTFFKRAILPELVGKMFSRPLVLSGLVNVPSDQPSQSTPPNVAKLICICQTVYDEDSEDDVIGCDNENCRFVWLHFSCVKIKRAPKGQWYCPTCRKLPQFKKKRAPKKTQ